MKKVEDKYGDRVEIGVIELENEQVVHLEVDDLVSTYYFGTTEIDELIKTLQEAREVLSRG